MHLHRLSELYGKVELVQLQAGLDPYLGIMHRDQYNRPSLVFDQIELIRPWAEEVLVELCLTGKLLPASFNPKNGGFWLNEQGKQVLIPAIYTYLTESAGPTPAGISRLEEKRRESQQLARWIDQR